MYLEMRNCFYFSSLLFMRNTEPCLSTERKEIFGREGRYKKEDIVRRDRIKST